MTRRYFKWLLGAVAAAAVTAGVVAMRNDSPDGASEHQAPPAKVGSDVAPVGPAAPKLVAGGSVRVRLTDALSLRPGMTVPLASSWDDLLRELTPEQQETARRLASRYPEAYTFSTSEQLAWMIEHGYPMPAEYVEAASMELDTLTLHARSGNIKAAMLAYDRVLDDMAKGIPPKNASVRVAELENQMRHSCSPFGNYLIARRHEDQGAARSGTAGADAMLSVMAAYVAAAAMGDRRVEQSAQRIAEGLDLSPQASLEVALHAARLRGRSRSDCNTSAIP